MRSFGSKQRNATGNNMCEISGKLVYFWEKVSVKKKTSCGQTKEKVIFFKKIQAKTIFLIKSKVKFLGCLRKNSWKTWFLCLKNASKKESWESLTKVWWKFQCWFRSQNVTNRKVRDPKNRIPVCYRTATLQCSQNFVCWLQASFAQ